MFFTNLKPLSMFTKVRFVLVLVLAMLCHKAHPQNQDAEKITISGVVKFENGSLADATLVYLMEANAGTLIKTEIPNKTGDFKFEDIQKGVYIIKVEEKGNIKYLGQKFEASANVDLGVLLPK